MDAGILMAVDIVLISLIIDLESESVEKLSGSADTYIISTDKSVTHEIFRNAGFRVIAEFEDNRRAIIRMIEVRT